MARKARKKITATLTDEELYGGKPGMLPRHIEYELATRWRRDEDYRARARILEAYQRLAISCASRASRSGLPFDDLLQEANIGMMAALDKFDPEMGNGFGTLARFHVLNRLQQHTLATIGTCRIFNTAPTKTLLSRYSTKRREIERELGAPLNEEGRERLCTELGVNREQLRRFEMAIATPLPIDLGAGNSADEPIRPIEIASSQDGDAEETQISSMARRQILSILGEVMRALPARERQIIMARYLSDPGKTLDALSKEFRISRERVRQLELKALDMLKEELHRRGVADVTGIFKGD